MTETFILVASPSFMSAPSPNFLLILCSAKSRSEVDFPEVFADGFDINCCVRMK